MDRLVGRNEKNTSKMDVSKHLVEIMDDSFEMRIKYYEGTSFNSILADDILFVLETHRFLRRNEG